MFDGVKHLVIGHLDGDCLSPSLLVLEQSTSSALGPLSFSEEVSMDGNRHVGPPIFIKIKIAFLNDFIKLACPMWYRNLST